MFYLSFLPIEFFFMPILIDEPGLQYLWSTFGLCPNVLPGETYHPFLAFEYS